MSDRWILLSSSWWEEFSAEGFAFLLNISAHNSPGYSANGSSGSAEGTANNAGTGGDRGKDAAGRKRFRFQGLL